MLNLPSEIVHHIFEYLNLDHLSTARLVCKQWNNFITKEYKMKEFACGYTEERVKFFWFTTNRTMLLCPSLYQADLLECPFNLHHLKYLMVALPSYIESLANFYDWINNLTHSLEVLELFISKVTKNEIKLSQLKSFYLKLTIEDDFPDRALKIDTPNVESVHIEGFEKYIEFVHPLSVTFLRSYGYDQNLCIFENVERLEIFEMYADLECTSNEEFQALAQNILTSFPKLRSFNFNHLLLDPDQFSSSSTINRNFIQQLLQQKLSLEKNDLQISFNGFYLSDDEIGNHFIDEILSLDFQYPENFQFFIDNYDKLIENICWMKYLDYSTQVESFYQSSIESFFKKFNCIESIRIDDKMEDENLLLKFISNCCLLNGLEISSDSKLGQSFFDRLPQVSSLHTIEIDVDKKLNFKFLSKMLNLTLIKANQDIDLSDVNLDNFKDSTILSFEINECTIEIEKHSTNSYGVRTGTDGEINESVNVKKFDLKNLIQFCDDIRQDKCEEESSAKRFKSL